MDDAQIASRASLIPPRITDLRASAREGIQSRPQGFTNGEIHGWYNFILGFSDKLVSKMLDRLSVPKGALVLDPFCGTGTTLVESMKRGINSIGIDASPFSCFVSRVKTNNRVTPELLLASLFHVFEEYKRALENPRLPTNSGTYKYLSKSGMLKRGWISATPLKKAIALKAAIHKVAPTAACRDQLLLALISNLSTKIGNMKYGPEIYCGPAKRNADVWRIFSNNVFHMARDLWRLPDEEVCSAHIYRGDARNCSAILHRNGIKNVDFVISSPPYPTEHDYTRNTRLELAFLDFVDGKESVQAIKRRMIRSHTKGIYKEDDDSKLTRENETVNRIAMRVARRCEGKSYGFARLYPTVIREYFGGMKRHFTSVAAVLKPGGQYGMVVGDQASYLGVHIATADVLGEIAEECGFEVLESFVWRTRWSTISKKSIKEHVLILKKAKA